MPTLEELCLRVADPNAQCRFYQDILGMRVLKAGCVGYGGPQARLRFARGDAPYVPGPDDLYWKIGLSVPNIELACDQLAQAGVDVGAPRQFEDVGYLAHFQDPEGFAIELIEHWFQGDRPRQAWDRTRLGGGAHLSLITLRTHDRAGMVDVCEAQGLTPLSVQPLGKYGFTLYFYAFTDERPPDPDLQAVANRTWVYRRPYTVLEVQHVHRLGTVQRPAPAACGYAWTGVRGGGGVAPDAADLLGLKHLAPQPPPAP